MGLRLFGAEAGAVGQDERDVAFVVRLPGEDRERRIVPLRARPAEEVAAVLGDDAVVAQDVGSPSGSRTGSTAQVG